MKIQAKILILTLAVLAVVLYFTFRKGTATENLGPGVHRVKAKEVLQTTNYTYVRVWEDKKEYWCALNKADIEAGKTYYWLKGWESGQFHSKELDRTFSSIYFIENLSDIPVITEDVVTRSPMAGEFTSGRQIMPEKQGIHVNPVQGGITIAELFANRKAYAGKSVKIRGEVVKFSDQIMKRNWIHLQDGTKDGNHYDLVVTTDETANTGDIIVLEGTISLDKDFGSGYFYEVIMEDAKIN